MSLRSHERFNVIADNSRRACFFASHDGLCLSFEAGGFSEPGLGKHSWFNASGGEIRGETSRCGHHRSLDWLLDR
jgi:hypothetical protein